MSALQERFRGIMLPPGYSKPAAGTFSGVNALVTGLSGKTGSNRFYGVRKQAFRAHEAAAYEVFATDKEYGGLSSEAATRYSSPARNVTGLRKFNVLE